MLQKCIHQSTPSSSAGSGNRNITYSFVSDTTGCQNSVVRSILISPKPSNFNFTGITNNQNFCIHVSNMLVQLFKIL